MYRRVLLFAFLCSIAGISAAADNVVKPAPSAVQVTEPDFSPPPVPEFMLRKPAQPLTLEQMKQQADEAAVRVRKPAKEPAHNSSSVR